MAEDYSVPVEEAVARLRVIEDYDPGDGPKPCVHTLALSGRVLLGAHWSVEEARALMEAHGVQVAGSTASSSGHGLVVLRPAPLGPLLLATKAEEER